MLKAGKSISNLFIIMSVIERKKTIESTRKPNQRGRLDTIDLLNKIACFVNRKSNVKVLIELISTWRSTVLTLLPFTKDSLNQLACILKAGKTVSNLFIIMSVIERKKSNESTEGPSDGRSTTYKIYFDVINVLIQ
jgi:hypothetical protein